MPPASVPQRRAVLGKQKPLHGTGIAEPHQDESESLTKAALFDAQKTSANQRVGLPSDLSLSHSLVSQALLQFPGSEMRCWNEHRQDGSRQTHRAWSAGCPWEPPLFAVVGDGHWNRAAEHHTH